MSFTPTWILTDGAAGNLKQCLALCHYLGNAPEIFSGPARRPWRAFAPRGAWGGKAVLPDRVSQALRAGQPKLVVSAGRQGALLSRAVGKASAQTVRRVHILNPRISARSFDLVITPLHDDAGGPNVIETMGSLNDVDDQTLREARSNWSDRLAHLPRPRRLFLIGGSNRALAITGDFIRSLAASAVKALESDGGSVMLSLAPRSEQAVKTAVRQYLSPLVSDLWSGDAVNPYAGYLAYADEITVTADSINMVSEACAVGVPVTVDYSEVTHGRFRRFYDKLSRDGYINRDAGACAPVQSLRETEGVADLVRQRLLRS